MPAWSTRWARWSRTDQVGLESLLYVVVGLGVLSVVPRVVAAVRGGPVSLETPLPEQLLQSRRGIEGPLTGTVVLDDPSGGQHVLALLPAVLTVVLLAVGVSLLLGVVRALRQGDPFTPGSARRLSWLAVLLIVGGIGVQLVEDVVRNRLLNDLGTLGEDVGASYTLPLWPLLAGVLVAFVAEVFARGSALRADVEGLV